MTILADLLNALRNRAVDVIDLTAPLVESTPILHLPEPFANTIGFRLEEISRYDDRGPGWYWNNIHTGEHTGTHFDAPIHWASGRDRADISQVPLTQLIAPAAVLDFSAQVAENPDFLVEVEHIKDWEAEHGALPEGGWLICRTGWDARSGSQDDFLNADDTGSHTPGFSTECARWLASEAPIIGIGVETVGTDAGAAPTFEPAFPCHRFLLGAGKYGLTQLRNVALLPPTGALVCTAPLPIVGGSGSPVRALALVERAA
ncbi:MAG: cyclase family protein [Sciscionella sp.]